MFLKVVLVFCLIQFCVAASKKKPRPFVQTDPKAKYDNPNYIRDRYRYEIYKPELPEYFFQTHRPPFNPAWMAYCDPWNCNSYHKTACGLNRDNKRFKLFQSECHIILNNKCSNWRGSLKYDIIDVKYCYAYNKNVRTSCNEACESLLSTVCAVASDGRAVMFVNKCAFERANCNTEIPEYEQVSMDVCDYYLQNKIKDMQKLLQ